MLNNIIICYKIYNLCYFYTGWYDIVAVQCVWLYVWLYGRYAYVRHKVYIKCTFSTTNLHV